MWATRVEKLVCSSTGMSDCRICYDALCNSLMYREVESVLLYYKRQCIYYCGTYIWCTVLCVCVCARARVRACWLDLMLVVYIYIIM